jgi:surface antigen
MMKYTYTIIFVLLLSACSAKPTIKETTSKIGQATGFAVDMALLATGYWIFSGAFTKIGEATGEVVGEVIEYVLSPDERKKVIKATKEALAKKDDTVVTWKSDENKAVSGRVETKAIEAKVSNTQKCKRVTQIVNISGRESKETIELCQQSNGSWSSR